MKSIVRPILSLMVLLIMGVVQKTNAQNVLNPKDSVVTYDSTKPPVQPPYGQIGKWVRTVQLPWNTNNYKAYIYKGNAFRLRFPQSYNPTAIDGKTYPLLIFFHGHGEADTCTKNELILIHGGQLYDSLNTNGTIDAYVLFMQSPGYWGQSQYDALKELTDTMIARNKVDPFHISIAGLSAGGQGVWDMTAAYPNYVASAEIMSAASLTFEDPSKMNAYKFTPIWLFQGGLDNFPAPYTTHQLVDSIYKVGGNLFYTELPDKDHNTWDPAFSYPDYIPFFKRAYSSNPWALGGRTSFFQGETINLVLGLPPGYQAYQWRKDSVIISGATTNTIQVTQTGSYSARVERNGIWSNWSPIPVVINYRAPGVNIPALIQAENYVAMHGVQTEPTTDSLGGLDVGYIDPSDYMDYDINVPSAGTYTLNFRVASPYSNAIFYVQNQNRVVLDTVRVPNTGGWQNWKTVSTTITLPAGQQTLRLNSVYQGWNINWMQFTSGTTAPPPPPPTSSNTIHIEAENYSAIHNAQTETTSDVGGGLDVGYISTGSYMNYSVNVPAAGTYTLRLRIATPAASGQLQFKDASGNVLTTVAIPTTGGWQTWQTTTATVNLQQGQQTLQIYCSSPAYNGWNINWFELASSSQPTANAGSNQTITLPTDSVQLSGSGSSPNGRIIKYAWTETSGPNQAVLSTPNAAATMAKGLIQGSYSFQLTVTDSTGATANSSVTVTVNPQPSTGTTSSTIHIEAENYSSMSGVQTETTSDTGGGLDVAYIDPGDYMNYQVSVPVSGVYTLRFRIATPAASGQLQLKDAAGNVLTTVAVPNTGGWQTWQTITATASLSAGTQTLQIYCSSPQWNGWNINWWELVTPGTAGSRTFAAAVTESTISSNTGVWMYPNPAIDHLQLNITNAVSGPATVQLVSMNGGLIRQYTLSKQAQTLQTTLSVAALPKGNYLLIVTMDGWKQSEKFIKL